MPDYISIPVSLLVITTVYVIYFGRLRARRLPPYRLHIMLGAVVGGPIVMLVISGLAEFSPVASSIVVGYAMVSGYVSALWADTEEPKLDEGHRITEAATHPIRQLNAKYIWAILVVVTYVWAAVGLGGMFLWSFSTIGLVAWIAWGSVNLFSFFVVKNMDGKDGAPWFRADMD